MGKRPIGGGARAGRPPSGAAPRFPTPATAEKILFPGGRAPKPWKKPESGLSIDDVVANLIKRRDEYRLRARADLARLLPPDGCPFHAVRRFIVMAARAGEWAVGRNTAIRRGSRPPRTSVWTGMAETPMPACAEIGMAGDLDRVRDDLLELARSIRELEVSTSEQCFASGISRLGEPVDRDHVKRVQAEALELLLQLSPARKAALRLAELAEAERIRIAPGRRDPDVWRFAFARHLGILWHTFTGCEPAPKADFLRFVSAAYVDIGGDDFDWGEVVGTVCKYVATWPIGQRHDRMSRRDVGESPSKIR